MKATIIITTFKRPDYLKRSLYSVINQTYQDYRCIVVNDCPEDAELIDAIISKLNDRRIILVNHGKSKGGNAARNTGVTQADGPIIAFLDDDDIWLPDKLSKHMERHGANPNIGMIYSNLILFWDNNLLPPILMEFQPPPLNPSVSMLKGEFWPSTTSGITVRKKCFDDCGLFDEELSSFQDWDMWCRIVKKYPIERISEPLAVLRQHNNDRTSISPERRIKGLEQIIAKWSNEIYDKNKFRNKFKKELFMNLARIHSIKNERRKGLSCLINFIKLIENKQDILSLMKIGTMVLLPGLYKKILFYKRENLLDNKLNQTIVKMIALSE